MDIPYINGVIAVREKYLLKDKIRKLCGSTLDEALKVLAEHGFGGAEAQGDAEAMITAENRATDEFIREYAPTAAERAYFLTARDFHNAKALVKAAYLDTDVEKLLAPEGEIPVKTLAACVQSGDYSALYPELQETLTEAKSLFKDENGEAVEVSGAALGAVFERGLYKRLFAACKRNSTLKRAVVERVDMTNILTYLRAADQEDADRFFLAGGKIAKDKLDELLLANEETGVDVLDGTPYQAFYRDALNAKLTGKPFTESERILQSADVAFLAARRYELKNTQPFTYYILRRRAECANVRILLVGLAAGMSEDEIKKRLRTVD